MKTQQAIFVWEGGGKKLTSWFSNVYGKSQNLQQQQKFLLRKRQTKVWGI